LQLKRQSLEANRRSRFAPRPAHGRATRIIQEKSMFFLLTASALLLAFGGVAGGVILACRFAWPRKVYDLVFGARA
jgi:hypothetical protein